MSKLIKIQLTASQLKSIIDMVDDIESMIGCGNDDLGAANNWDKSQKKKIILIDRMLKKNGFKRR